MVELWGDIGFLVFSGSTALFTLLYLTLSRWYATLLGTLIAIFMFGVSVLCTYIALRIWGINLPAVEYVRLTVFWVVGLSMAFSVAAFLRVQFGSRSSRLVKKLSTRYDDVRHREAEALERE